MMQERSKQIFGNNIASGAYRKAVRSKQKFIRKFGDDSTKNYPTSIKANPYIGPELGVSDIRVGEEGAADFHTEKGIIVGNIRMGFGHYRISMAKRWGLEDSIMDMVNVRDLFRKPFYRHIPCPVSPVRYPDDTVCNAVQYLCSLCRML